jgi:hypothetical protein
MEEQHLYRLQTRFYINVVFPTCSFNRYSDTPCRPQHSQALNLSILSVILLHFFLAQLAQLSTPLFPVSWLFSGTCIIDYSASCENQFQLQRRRPHLNLSCFRLLNSHRHSTLRNLHFSSHSLNHALLILFSLFRAVTLAIRSIE